MKIYDKRSKCEKARTKLKEDIIETESKIVQAREMKDALEA